jgi:hypothetical protein
VKLADRPEYPGIWPSADAHFLRKVLRHSAHLEKKILTTMTSGTGHIKTPVYKNNYLKVHIKVIFYVVFNK